jgi:hypothetical protein
MTLGTALASLVATLLALVGGMLYFGRIERSLADIL